jgi:uncharacterized protein (DUF3084 family)
MKLSELKKEIKEYIVEILSEIDEITMVGPDTEISDIPSIAKTERTNPTTVKAALDQAKKTKQAVGVAESEDEDTTPDEDTLDKQAAAAAKKEKVKGAPSKFKISQEQYEKLKKTLKTVVDKVKELDKKIKDPNTKQSELKDLKDQKTRKMESLKQFIKNPELVKAFKERDVKIDTGELID